MSKSELKDIITMIIFYLANIVITYTLTYLLGVMNTIIMSSVMYGDITLEVVFFMCLSLLEAIGYEYYNKFVLDRKIVNVKL